MNEIKSCMCTTHVYYIIQIPEEVIVYFYFVFTKSHFCFQNNKEMDKDIYFSLILIFSLIATEQNKTKIPFGNIRKRHIFLLFRRNWNYL